MATASTNGAVLGTGGGPAPEVAPTISAASSNGTTVDAGTLRPVIAQMQAYLADFDAAAADYLAANRAQFQALFTPDALAQFEARVEAFGFEEAEALLAAALDQREAGTGGSAPSSPPSTQSTVDDAAQTHAGSRRCTPTWRSSTPPRWITWTPRARCSARCSHRERSPNSYTMSRPMLSTKLCRSLTP